MDKQYWTNFWIDSGKETVGKNSQLRVLRTKNRVPIPDDQWGRTLAYVESEFPTGPESKVLDVCAGTGLFSKAFAAQGAQVTAVDVSSELLSDIDLNDFPLISKICTDMRSLALPDKGYTHIFCYAGIQYLSHREAVGFVRSCFEWLRPGGKLMLGDVPDANLRWEFYDSTERRSRYFQTLEEGVDVIGTWFERDWLRYLGESAGFGKSRFLHQPADQIYAHYRFDAFFEK